MSRVTVWKSDTDGKLFENKEKYVAHLRKLARERLTNRKILKVQAERADVFAKMGQLRSIEEVQQFIIDNWKWFFLNGLTINNWKNRAVDESVHELVSIRLDRMRWSDSISNSHSCPKNGVTNFFQKNNAPTGYPGWAGVLHFSVRPPMYTYRKKKYRKSGWGSDYFRNTIICTESGGGGGYDEERDLTSFQYSIILWADDFPAMNDMRLKKELMKHLKGETVEPSYF